MLAVAWHIVASFARAILLSSSSDLNFIVDLPGVAHCLAGVWIAAFRAFVGCRHRCPFFVARKRNHRNSLTLRKSVLGGSLIDLVLAQIS